jgi:hypothetical protein
MPKGKPYSKATAKGKPKEGGKKGLKPSHTLSNAYIRG